MSTAGPGSATPDRIQRRKARTRTALIRAAQGFIAQGRLHIPISDITEAADVGMGSFYNHFDSRETLFEAAVLDALDAHGALLDQLTADLDDPATRFAQSFRLTGRMHRLQPQLSLVLLNHGLKLTSATTGLGPRARRDLKDAVDAGRFVIDDLDLALVLTAGATICLGQLLHEQPDRDDGDATDKITADLLRTFGLTALEARRLAQRPLPALQGRWPG